MADNARGLERGPAVGLTAVTLATACIFLRKGQEVRLAPYEVPLVADGAGGKGDRRWIK